MPQVEDTEWFFDTELLLLAEEGDLRIHEVPVDWIEDFDSRVDMASAVMKKREEAVASAYPALTPLTAPIERVALNTFVTVPRTLQRRTSSTKMVHSEVEADPQRFLGGERPIDSANHRGGR